jgi:hypothetical protein
MRTTHSAHPHRAPAAHSDAQRQNGPYRASHATWRTTVAATARQLYISPRSCIAQAARGLGDEIGPQTRAPEP